MRIAPAPLFCDPIYDGPTDPTLIYNREEKEWWIIYTVRRANMPCRGVGWVHGTDLGIASSKDHGQTWLYRGTLNLEAIERGRNTYWAPEVLYAGGVYHMYVSYITGVPEKWIGDRRILHYTSKNLWDWQFESVVPLPSTRVIDACVYPTRAGWRMWYKDECDSSHTHYADSPDLYTWTYQGVATCDQPQEGPNVFTLGGKHWMIADAWDGQAVYHSEDLTSWQRQPGQLMSGAGQREGDTNRAHHADVEVIGDKAYMFYFVHPQQATAIPDSPAHRRSCVQVAELRVEDGQLVAVRNEPFDFYLPDMEA